MKKPTVKPNAVVEEMLAAVGLETLRRPEPAQRPTGRYQALLQTLRRRDRATAS